MISGTRITTATATLTTWGQPRPINDPASQRCTISASRMSARTIRKELIAARMAPTPMPTRTNRIPALTPSLRDNA